MKATDNERLLIVITETNDTTIEIERKLFRGDSQMSNDYLRVVANEEIKRIASEQQQDIEHTFIDIYNTDKDGYLIVNGSGIVSRFIHVEADLYLEHLDKSYCVFVITLDYNFDLTEDAIKRITK